MPPLPVVYGVLGLPSGTKAIMAEKPGEPSRSVHAGDTIGEFKIASLDPQNVVFDWDGKQISRKNRRSDRPVESRRRPAGAQVAARAVPPGGAAPRQPQHEQCAAGRGRSGQRTGAGTAQRACVPGDTSPAGTVVDGYKKNVDADALRRHVQLGASSVNGDIKL